MKEYDFENSVGFWLSITTNSLHRRLAEQLAPFDITFRQMQVIAWLAREKKLTQSELACRLMVEPPTLAGILSRMENCGWITRTQCAQDRRKNWIQMTKKVVPIWNQMTKRMANVREEATAGLSKKETGELFRLLRKVHVNLGSTDDRTTQIAKSSNR